MLGAPICTLPITACNPPPGLGYSEGGSKASEYQGDEKGITLECASHPNIIISHEINSHARYTVAFDQ